LLSDIDGIDRWSEGAADQRFGAVLNPLRDIA
jgi:hypothetical protein